MPPMSDLMDKVDSPLRSRTPPAWVDAVMSDVLALLNDHAHLEKKAASNALDLLNKWPQGEPPDTWAATTSSIARDEVEHLNLVLRILRKRGGEFSRSHRNPYAKDLRELERSTPGGIENLMDRLMTSALIELRSCERFAVLAQHCPDAELAKLYKGLWASEHGHFRTFLNMAEDLPGVERDAIEARWGELLDAEARIIAQQPAYCGMHSGAAT